jgi:hypothetical protein
MHKVQAGIQNIIFSDTKVECYWNIADHISTGEPLFERSGETE